ncbi:hypothetical protein SGRA_1234 [Saprospira grandis str. Lewin]|uniref:Uncharacterized protein n=1 Tax=Saprospira grandis (strain Lewin) TaxID=984262 RepID=H6L4P5_SAPGL|nr:hypothetical protein SGRA_1234 [Saprospira grandis str. Lewin]
MAALAEGQMAQRCGGVAEGQTKGETKWSLKGRAELRAPKPWVDPLFIAVSI